MRLEHDEDGLDVAPELIEAVRHALDELDGDLADKSAPRTRPDVGHEGREQGDLVRRAFESRTSAGEVSTLVRHDQVEGT